MDTFHDGIGLMIVTAEARNHGDSFVHIQSLDHVPIKAVERIALAMMERNTDETTQNMYKVIINFKAAVVLYTSNLQTSKSPAVAKHIRQLEYEYLSAALTALDNISFMTPPSLLLVQVLITGVHLRQTRTTAIKTDAFTGYDDADHRQSCVLLGADGTRLTHYCCTRLSQHYGQ